MGQTSIGQMGWMDLTVDQASTVKAFYETVVGWTTLTVEMDGYEDYCMIPPGTETPVVGICHARGPNRDLPPQWIPYFNVADLDRSLEGCRASGGTVVREPKSAGGGRFALVRDPGGAVCALYQTDPGPADPAAPLGT